LPPLGLTDLTIGSKAPPVVGQAQMPEKPADVVAHPTHPPPVGSAQTLWAELDH